MTSTCRENRFSVLRPSIGFRCLALFFPLCLILSTLLVAEDVQQGVSFFVEGRYDEAKALFESFLQSHPDHPEALFYLGRLETDGAAAQKYFRTVWTKHPNHPLADDALLTMCQYHFAKGYYVTAGKRYRDLVKTYPESEYADDATYWSGTCYLVAERPDSALMEWRSLLTTHPQSELRDWAVLGVGDALMALNKANDALSEYKRIVDSSTDQQVQSAALYRLGQCHESLQHSATAREYYNRVIQEYPQSYEGAILTGQRQKTSGSFPQANHTYTIQVGAFAHKANAIRLHDALSQKGYDVEVVSKNTESGTLLHAVQIGTYVMKEDAQVVVERLEREERLQPRIISKTDQ
jgi:TolA-binding protein